jgi:hypothetical protein
MYYSSVHCLNLWRMAQDVILMRLLPGAAGAYDMIVSLFHV